MVAIVRSHNGNRHAETGLAQLAIFNLGVLSHGGCRDVDNIAVKSDLLKYSYQMRTFHGVRI